MNDLTEFLLARIAEDAGTAKRVPPFSHRDVVTALPFGPTRVYVAAWEPSRVLRECDAKRRIVGLWREATEGLDEDDVAFTMSMSEYPSGVLAALSATLHRLALAYADHPDYRDEWRP